MRSLITFGCLALFLGSAFITPSEDNVLARAESARTLVESTVRGAVALQSVPHSREIVSTVDVLRRVAKSGAVSKAVSIVRRPVVTSKEWKSLLKEKNSESLQTALEEIDFAARKHDPRLCLTLDPSQSDRAQFTSPTIGDLLALCLAKVSADFERCSAIDPVTGATLRSICEGELVRPA